MVAVLRRGTTLAQRENLIHWFEDMGLTEDSGMIYRRVSRNIFAEVQKLREEGLDIMENRWKEV